MLKFTKIAAQGELTITKLSRTPNNIGTEEKPINGRLIVGHSETGHHHVMVLDREADGPSVEMFNSTDNPLVSWLRVNRPTALEHRRPHDTHEPIMFGPGVYEVRRQREHTPEGWKQIQD